MTELDTGAIRVVLADDHPMMRDGLRRSLEAFGLDVVAEVSNGREAVAAVEEHHPDVVVMDLWMPVMDGVRATEIIRVRHPEVEVAILTFDTSEAQQERALAAGATQVITKDTEAGELVERIRNGGIHPTTAQGRNSVDESLLLTPREVEVLQLIVRGSSTPAIASTLFISQKTVKNHLASIYTKLDVADRTQAVLAALRLGILSLDRATGQMTYSVPDLAVG